MMGFICLILVGTCLYITNLYFPCRKYVVGLGYANLTDLSYDADSVEGVDESNDVWIFAGREIRARGNHGRDQVFCFRWSG
jgi:hypothetical protein